MAGHDVWLVTRENNRTALEAGLGEDAHLLEGVIRPVYLDLPRELRWWKKGQRGVRTYYVLWQRYAAREMRKLHHRHGFDVAHHLTFATDWLPAPVVRIPGLPSIWGPVGGTTKMPWVLAPYLGVTGLATEVGRTVISGLGRKIWGTRAARDAALIACLNEDAARRYSSYGPTVLEPNSAFSRERMEPLRSIPGAHAPALRAVFASRLEPWKGLLVAIDAMRYPAAAGWELHVYGDGPDEKRARGRIKKYGLETRVTLHGRVSRSEMLASIATADALVHPAFRDSAPWTVGEAVTLGVPVVCLSTGGPPTLSAPGVSRIVQPSRTTASSVAGSLRELAVRPEVEPTDRWMDDRLPGLLTRWYRFATGEIDDGIRNVRP